jgi:hypothetical protein
VPGESLRVEPGALGAALHDAGDAAWVQAFRLDVPVAAQYLGASSR